MRVSDWSSDVCSSDLSLTDTERNAGKGKDLAKAWLKQDGAEVARRVGAVERYARLGGKVFGKGMEEMQDPTLTGVLAKEGGAIARELVHPLAQAVEPPPILCGRLGVRPRVSWAEPTA